MYNKKQLKKMSEKEIRELLAMVSRELAEWGKFGNKLFDELDKREKK